MDALEGLLVGILSAICLIYAFQTRVVYPKFILVTLEEPWILAAFTVIAILISSWSSRISALLLLCISALLVDKLVFARKHTKFSKNFTSVNDYNEHSYSGLSIAGKIEDKQLMNNLEVDYGEPLTSINKPIEYPMFYGLNEHPIGPAPV